MYKKLRKSATDRTLTGVCGGIADFVGIPSLAVRLIFIFLPANVLIYLVLVVAMENSPPSL